MNVEFSLRNCRVINWKVAEEIIVLKYEFVWVMMLILVCLGDMLKIFNLLHLMRDYWKNGTQWMGRIVARTMGEHNYELVRLEKRIAYANYYYVKQYILNKLSFEAPDVVNAFGVLQKEDTSHGFPFYRPHERNSDFALYNVNSEGWFQMWSVITAISTT